MHNARCTGATLIASTRIGGIARAHDADACRNHRAAAAQRRKSCSPGRSPGDGRDPKNQARAARRQRDARIADDPNRSSHHSALCKLHECRANRASYNAPPLPSDSATSSGGDLRETACRPLRGLSLFWATSISGLTPRAGALSPAAQAAPRIRCPIDLRRIAQRQVPCFRGSSVAPVRRLDARAPLPRFRMAGQTPASVASR